MPPALDHSFAPPNVDLWLERSLLNGIVLADVAYGILFSIAVQCIWGLVDVYRRTGTVKWWVAIYISGMTVLATVAIGMQNLFNQWCFIDFRDYPGGPYVFNIDFYATPVNVAAFSIYTIMAWIADGLVLYRFFVIYNHNRVALVIPAIVWLGGVASGILLLVSVTHSDNSFFSEQSVNIGTAFWSISMGLNIILTVLIVVRLLLSRYRVRNTIGPRYGQNYISIISMLIESAALYSIWALVFLITYARGSAAQNILLPPLGQIQAIAPLLILTRVIGGRALGTSVGPSYSNNYFRSSGPGTTTATTTSTAETRVEIPLKRFTAQSSPSSASGILIQKENLESVV
ncbi:hypothetical protein D9758_006797 [Tetrapyrgos nigripes]|uniref:Uncharacterized protein n=1 Tax=Tetrapyrgos nigripes TaxID=182062 RepID=A0A8H5CX95_9AGAR|nr:hypothetical protein D9758_006797 [Tetrapyrgos nigripes]